MSGVEREDLFIVIVGAEGSGKTILSIALGCALYPDFSESLVFYEKDKLRRAYNKAINAKIEKCVFVVDEPKMYSVHHASKDAQDNRVYNAAIRECMFINIVNTQSLNLIPDSELIFRRADILLKIDRHPTYSNARLVKCYLGEEYSDGLLLTNVYRKGRKWFFGVPNSSYYFNKNKFFGNERINEIFLKSKEYKLNYVKNVSNSKSTDKEFKVKEVLKSLNISIKTNKIIDRSKINAWKIGTGRKEWMTSSAEIKKLVAWLVSSNLVSEYNAGLKLREWNLE